MNTITANQRTINIINRAIENGFEFDEDEKLEEVRISAEDFLIENTEAIEEECEVKSLGNHGQRVDWYDGKGFEFWSQGGIVDFGDHWHKAPETKIFHETVIDSEGQVVKLFYYVGETAYNAPEGFYFNKNSEKHTPLTYDIVFNDDENSNNNGFSLSLEDAESYIRQNNGTNESYFADYKGGSVSIVCNETDETILVVEIN